MDACTDLQPELQFRGAGFATGRQICPVSKPKDQLNPLTGKILPSQTRVLSSEPGFPLAEAGAGVFGLPERLC